MDLTEKFINGKYHIIEKIGEGGMSTIWLAEDLQQNQVAIKVLKKDATSNRIEDLIRFRNEATTVSKLNLPGIIKIFEIGEFENLNYIVMEYVNGKSLFELLKEGYKFGIDDTVEIIYKVGSVLQFIHDSNIIHRDLKPENIIVVHGPAIHQKKTATNNWDIRLIDFGLAQIKEFNSQDTPTTIGTLCYMAPELSGLIKRMVDERSDLYSVGVIFYQILTGQLPFQSENNTSYGPITKIPRKPTYFDPKVPEILEKIVLKLLERNPDRRYQSALGLVTDLEKYRIGENDFVPGVDDKFIKLNYQTQLIGRDDELNELKSLFENTLNGSGSICLISGEAGSGKTRLTEELRNYVYEKQGIFIDGKCFFGQIKTPYGPFKDTLNVYMRDFNKKYPASKKKKIREEILEYIGDLGEIIVTLNPVLEEITGKCPPLVNLEPEIENQRFLIIATEFFYHLSIIEDVMVIMLDDLHWSDEGSFELLNQLAKEVFKYPLLIIGTFRDNEIFEGHGLRRFMKDASANHYSLHHIPLKPFDNKNINKFIAGLLYDNEENTKEISGFVFQKSKGNPFFTIEIIKQLVAEKAIVLHNATWSINDKVIGKIQIPSTVVDILLKKISLLDDKEINILSYAAIVGRKFDIELLFLLGDLNKVEIVEVVDHAIELQLLEEDLHERGKIRFVHDRIKEAFNKNINHENRRSLHLKIAETLENIYRNDLDKAIFDLAYHYIEGECQDKALEYSYPAGIKAKNNFAYDEAIEYFIIVKYMLEQTGKQGQAQWIECMEHIGDIYVSSGKINETIDLYKELYPFFKTKLDKAKTYGRISNAYYKKSDWQKCEEFGRLGLKTLGEDLPDTKIGTVLMIIRESIIHFFHPLLHAPKASFTKNTAESEQIIWLYYVLSLIYSLLGSLKFIGAVLRMINLAESKIGKSQELALSIMSYALYLAEIPKYKPAIKYHQKALQLRKELNDDRGLAQSYLNMGYYYKCKGEYEKSIQCFKENIAILNRIGDVGEIGATLCGLVGVYIYLADYESAKMANHQYYEVYKKVNSHFILALIWMFDSLCYMEKGDFENAELFGITSYKLAYKEKGLYMCCLAGVALGRLFMEKGDYEKAIDYLKESRDLFEKNRFLKEYTVPLFPYLADAYLGEYLAKRNELSKTEAKILLNRVHKSCKEALSKTKLWKTYHIASLRVYAKYLALTGNHIVAKNAFLGAIDLAKTLGRKYELALSFYEYGNFLDKINKTLEAQKNREAAYEICLEIGAMSYQQKIAATLGIRETNPASGEESSETFEDNERLEFVLSCNREMSSILDLDQLLGKIVSIAMEITNAHRGYLILNNGTESQTAEKNINTNDPVFKGFSMSLIHHVLEKGEPILFPGGLKKTGNYEYQSVIHQELKSVVCIPIKNDYKITGVCYLDNPQSKPVFTETDIEKLTLITNQAAISIKNALIYKQVAVSFHL